MKRVLVSGASGFVGANLIRRLLRDDHEVHIVMTDPAPRWRLTDVADSVRIHIGDLSDRDAVRRIMATVRPEWLFHLATHGAYSWQTDVARIVRTNVEGSISLLDAAIDAGVEAFVQAGSSSEYGFKDHAPSESEALQPNSVYAVAKAAATHYCQFRARRSGVHAVTARLYSVYGPYEEPTRLVPTLLSFGLQGKLPPLVHPMIARDFVYVDDAVEAMLRMAAKTELPRGLVFNVCTGVQTTLAEVVATAESLLNLTVESEWSSMAARSWDTETWVGDPSSAQRLLGWRAGTDFRSGLERTLAWLTENADRRRLYEAAGNR